MMRVGRTAPCALVLLALAASLLAGCAKKAAMGNSPADEATRAQKSKAMQMEMMKSKGASGPAQDQAPATK